MQHLRRAALLAAMAIAAAAIGAGPASATDTVEVVNEKTGTHCALTGSSQCNVHMTGVMTVRIDFGIFGEGHEMRCDLELESRWNETGGGFIDAIEKTPGDANCPTLITECSQPWPTSGEEDGPSGVLQSSSALCIDPSEGPVCSGNFVFDISELAGEAYALQASNASVGLCELDVDAATEDTVASNAALHVNHP